ncbi:interleukin-4 [Saccopteryx bilineata]|uniref:interleukin-4 n=1 Tax=Saccopteryx bilineata TaxID=59482 RepID=UPI00338E4824
MGLTSQLIPALVCLLACASCFIHGCRRTSNNVQRCRLNTLKENIKMLTGLRENMARDPQCMELTVADVLKGPQNTAEKDTFCRAMKVIRQVYSNHRCWSNNTLYKLDRNLNVMANKNCSVNEAEHSTFKEFLDKLTTIMQEKYSKS